jgi:serine protease Do
MNLLPVLLAASLAQPQAPPPTSAGAYARLKPSLFTIEIHSGNREAKSSLGSGYLVSADGLIATNFHVVASFVEDPVRNQLRAKSEAGEHPLTLVQFDMVNDLALVRAAGVTGKPLALAATLPENGERIISFGNPEGLGMSLIEGNANGLATKGVVPRLLLSMPLNSGMSGGPILNARDEVVGTNVSVQWLSNSLSFGVPTKALRELMTRPALTIAKPALQAELNRQIDAVEKTTFEALTQAFDVGSAEPDLVIGGARSKALPAAFACWDNRQEFEREGVVKSQYGCDLQFTPSTEKLGPIASVQLQIEHFASEHSSYGFYGYLPFHAESHQEVPARAAGDPDLGPPECASNRVRLGEETWKITTCAVAFKATPGIFDVDLVATSLSRPKEAMFLSLGFKGFRMPSALELTKRLLGNVSWRTN